MRASDSSAVQSHGSGVGFLATCHQAYNEGHRMFYELNTLQIPHGPLKHSLQCFQGLTHEHRAMIRKVAILLDWSDFTPEVLQESDPGQGRDLLTSSAMKAVKKIWKEKIRRLSSCHDLGGIVLIEFGHFPMSRRILHELQAPNDLLQSPERAMRYALRNFNWRQGWELTKLWI